MELQNTDFYFTCSVVLLLGWMFMRLKCAQLCSKREDKSESDGMTINSQSVSHNCSCPGSVNALFARRYMEHDAFTAETHGKRDVKTAMTNAQPPLHHLCFSPLAPFAWLQIYLWQPGPKFDLNMIVKYQRFHLSNNTACTPPVFGFYGTEINNMICELWVHPPTLPERRAGILKALSTSPLRPRGAGQSYMWKF